jgi:FkbM family methyltransferase
MSLIELNGFTDSEIIPVACDTCFGVKKLHFFLDSPFDPSASLIGDFRKSASDQPASFVSTAPLSACLDAAGVSKLGLVKIDVEGYEAEVLEALKPRMKLDRPFVIVEILPAYAESNPRAKELERIRETVSATDYSILEITKTNSGRLDSFNRIRDFGIHGDTTLVDFVLCPTERLNECDCVE